jgi:hypothetical protein
MFLVIVTVLVPIPISIVLVVFAVVMVVIVVVAFAPVFLEVMLAVRTATHYIELCKRQFTDSIDI